MMQDAIAFKNNEAYSHADTISDSRTRVGRLIDLEYEVADVCAIAIKYLADARIKDELDDFIYDHVQRAADLGPELETLGETFTTTGTAKRISIESSVKLAALLGDTTILKTLVEKQYELLRAYQWAAQGVAASTSLASRLREAIDNEHEHINALQQCSQDVASF